MFYAICLTSLVGLVGCFYIINYIKEYKRYLKLTNLLPGPVRHPIWQNMKDLIYADDVNLFETIRKWGRNYSPIYNISVIWTIPSANITGPEDFEIIARSTKNISKGKVYGFLSGWLGEGLLTSTGSKWQRRRKILTPAFHFSILQQFVAVFNSETNHLVNILKKECHKPFINVVPHISQFTLSTINETSMGTKLDLSKDEDKIYYSSIHKLGKAFYYRIFRPWLYIHSIYYNLFPVGYNEKRLLKCLHNFTNNIISKKEKTFEKFEMPSDEEINYSKRKKLAMLDLLLNAKISDRIIDDDGIQDEVNTFMFEGHDTVSMSICFTLMLLAYHRNIQDLIFQEINEVIGETDWPPSFDQLQQITFTERCIKESLRLYPSVPFIARNLEKDVVTSQGYTLPKGLEVNLHIFDIHRNVEYWPNPEKFDPDRFLPENCQNRHPFAYVPFSAGPRNCIGQRYAILELKAVLCGILRNFILEPVDTPENIKLVPDIVLRAQNDTIRVKFTLRN